MKQTINLSQFRDAFMAVRPDNFSYEGLEVLFDSFESLDDDTGNDSELDVIAICCEFSESTLDEIVDNYDIDLSISGNLTSSKNNPIADEIKKQAVMGYLNYHAFVAGVTPSGTVVYQDF